MEIFKQYTQLTKKIFSILTYKQRVGLFYLFFLMIIGALFELVGIGLVIPLLNLLINDSSSSEIFIFNYFYERYEKRDIILLLLVFIIIFYLFKTILMSFILWFKIIYYEKIIKYLSAKLFKKYLNQDYLFHISRNTSELLTNIKINITEFSQLGINSFLSLSTEILIILFIITFLFFYQPYSTLVVVFLLVLIAFIFNRIFNKKVKQSGKESIFHTKMYQQTLTQGLQNFKEIQLLGRQQDFVDSFNIHVEKNMKINSRNTFIQQIPRVWLELILILLLILTIGIFVLIEINYNDILITMGLYAVVGIKLMPSIARMATYIQRINFHIPKIHLIYNELNLKENDRSNNINEKFLLKKEIELKDISFGYSQNNLNIFEKVNFKFKVNDKVGIVGDSGSGKSTLMDILLGLINPISGQVNIDGIDIKDVKNQWQNNIGYVPQNIMMIDDTILKNVAFGYEKDKIDIQRINKSLVQSDLFNFINSLPQGVETNVGEFGSSLSGGQLQRIGIARALYSNPDILFLDEPSSALDINSEKNIIDSLMKLKDKTIFIISHRIQSLEKCDYIIKIGKGKIEILK